MVMVMMMPAMVMVLMILVVVMMVSVIMMMILQAVMVMMVMVAMIMIMAAAMFMLVMIVMMVMVVQLAMITGSWATASIMPPTTLIAFCLLAGVVVMTFNLDLPLGLDKRPKRMLSVSPRSVLSLSSASASSSASSSSPSASAPSMVSSACSPLPWLSCLFQAVVAPALQLVVAEGAHRLCASSDVQPNHEAQVLAQRRISPS